MEIYNIVYYLKKLLMTLHLDSHSTTDVTPEMIGAVKSGKRIQPHGKNVCGITLRMSRCSEETSFQGKTAKQ